MMLLLNIVSIAFASDEREDDVRAPMEFFGDGTGWYHERLEYINKNFEDEPQMKKTMLQSLEEEKNKFIAQLEEREEEQEKNRKAKDEADRRVFVQQQMEEFYRNDLDSEEEMMDFDIDNIDAEVYDQEATKIVALRVDAENKMKN